MRKSTSIPSIVPRDDDQDVYLVMDDLGKQGQVWRETDPRLPSWRLSFLDLLEGQYKKPIVCSWLSL